MPNALTHNYISGIIYRALPADIRRAIDRNRKEYDLGALGPDIIMGLLLNKDPVKKSAGDRLHVECVYEGLDNALQYLRKHPEDKALRAYWLGFLTHYAADTCVHPYVYEYIDNRMRQKYDPVLYGCLHTIVETEMDVYVGHVCLKGRHADTFYRFSWSKRRRDVVDRYFLKVNRDVFRLTLDRHDVNQSFLLCALLFFVCHRHRNGKIRFALCQWLDNYFKVEHMLMACLRPRYPDSRYDYLNMERKPYKSIYRGVDAPIVSYSFPEMIENAKEKGVALITEAWRLLFEPGELPQEMFLLNYNGEPNAEFVKEIEAMPDFTGEEEVKPPFDIEEYLISERLTRKEDPVAEPEFKDPQIILQLPKSDRIENDLDLINLAEEVQDV